MRSLALIPSLLLLLARIDLLVAQSAPLFSGCGAVSGFGPDFSGVTKDQCASDVANTFAGTNIKYAWYRPSDSSCFAADTAIGFYDSSNNQAHPAASTSFTGCDDNQITSYYVTSTFAFAQCVVPLAPYGSGILTQTTDKFDSCASFCKDQLQMLVVNPSPGTWNCYCGASIPVGPPTFCGAQNAQTAMFYTHAPQYTGQMRRRMVARKTLCPFGQQACVSPDTADGYECIDTSSELESCGGCTYASYRNSSAALGVDCTSLPGVTFDGVICDNGQCLVGKCESGFYLEDGECVEEEEDEAEWW